MRNKIVLLCLGVLLLSGCIREDGDELLEGANISIGDRLPSLDITLQDESQITNSNIQGKVSLIILFSVTCPDCQEQFKAVEQLYQQIKDDDRFILFGISRAQDEKTVSQYWTRNGLSFPYSAQPDRYVYSLFATTGVPRIYISGPDMIVKFMSDDKPLASLGKLHDALYSALGSE